DGGCGHPDHMRAHDLTMAIAARSPAVRRVFHPVTPTGPLADRVAALPAADAMPCRSRADGARAGEPDERATTATQARANRDATGAALRAHRTQVSVPTHTAGQPYYALSNEIAQPVLDTEYFVLARGPGEGADSDLFGGLE